VICNIDGQMKKRGRMRTAIERNKRENPCTFRKERREKTLAASLYGFMALYLP
jgi:hypothetical protein